MMKNTVFLKESSSLKKHLEQLQMIDHKNLPNYLQKQLDREINSLKKGMTFERKNSKIDTSQ